MNRLKATYTDSVNKKKVRDYVFEYYKHKGFDTIIGLAGPDINTYIEKCQQLGCDTFEIYEKDAPTAVKQIKALRTTAKVSLKYTDILNADANRHNALYDLDFCASVRYLKKHIAKFKDNFIMTFSTRIGVEETIKTFFKARREKILNRELLDMGTKFTTSQGEYLFIQYFDTSAMGVFVKL